MDSGPNTKHHLVLPGESLKLLQWSEYEASLSSTWRELKPVAIVLSAIVIKLAGHS